MTEESLDARLARIRLAAFDVDGVFTDAGFTLGSDGSDRVRFNTRDGMGIRVLLEAGIRVVLISGRRSGAVARRAAELGIDRHLSGVSDKREALAEIRVEEGMSRDETLFCGDDLQDLAAFAESGVAVAVADAAPEVRERADVVLERAGGSGAVRELAERLLRARGEWESVVRRYAGEKP
jgi:3-deoxy-D-manno-octulosonate 8-phosphate phosphatase (KDO 8-P phosphatase)